MNSRSQRHVGKRIYLSKFSGTRQYFEVNGQFHISVALNLKKVPPEARFGPRPNLEDKKILDPT
jgi:hypothetical protein